MTHRWFQNRSNVSVAVPAASAALPALEPAFADLTFGGQALQKLLRDYAFRSVLDVGSGAGQHSRILANCGKSVTAVDLGTSVYAQEHDPRVTFVAADYVTHSFDRPFDAIWACHVLEHQPNPNAFLRKVLADTAVGGPVAITVPPPKPEIVGGHVTLWNAGLLLYHLVLAGNDCRDAAILKYRYNISLIVPRRPIPDADFPELTFDSGDIDRLAMFLPDGLREPFDGDITELNWRESIAR